jgi:hypothetical protein
VDVAGQHPDRTTGRAGQGRRPHGIRQLLDQIDRDAVVRGPGVEDAGAQRGRCRACKTSRGFLAHALLVSSSPAEPVCAPKTDYRDSNNPEDSQREGRGGTAIDLGHTSPAKSTEEQDIGHRRQQHPGNDVEHVVLLGEKRRDPDERSADQRREAESAVDERRSVAGSETDRELHRPVPRRAAAADCGPRRARGRGPAAPSWSRR